MSSFSFLWLNISSKSLRAQLPFTRFKDYRKTADLYDMTLDPQTDYKAYKEIMIDLQLPIPSDNLDAITLKKLYQSKLVYLENLRVRCFYEVNSQPNTQFTLSDYQYILNAKASTQTHLRQLVFECLANTLSL